MFSREASWAPAEVNSKFVDTFFSFSNENTLKMRRNSLQGRGNFILQGWLGIISHLRVGSLGKTMRWHVSCCCSAALFWKLVLKHFFLFCWQVLIMARFLVRGSLEVSIFVSHYQCRPFAHCIPSSTLLPINPPGIFIPCKRCHWVVMGQHVCHHAAVWQAPEWQAPALVQDSASVLTSLTRDWAPSPAGPSPHTSHSVCLASLQAEWHNGFI